MRISISQEKLSGLATVSIENKVSMTLKLISMTLSGQKRGVSPRPGGIYFFFFVLEILLLFTDILLIKNGRLLTLTIWPFILIQI
jgi:hypothetical protein